MAVYFNKAHTKLLHDLAERFECDIFSKEYEETINQIYMILTSYFQRRCRYSFSVIPVKVFDDISYLFLLKSFINKCAYPITITGACYVEEKGNNIDYLTITWEREEYGEEA